MMKGTTRMKSRYAIVSATAICGFLVLVSGCETAPQKKDAGQKPLYENMVKVQEAEISQLKARLNMLQDSFTEQTKSITTLNQNMQILEQRNQGLQNEISSLRQAICEEKQERQAALDSIVNKVGKEIGKAMTVTAAAQAKESAEAGKVPIGPGPFVKYEVQAGATLNAIAQAYKVTVEDIKKANKLKSDSLKTGQLLYIPKK